MAGAFQESDGSTSIRRILAAILTLCAVACFFFAFQFAQVGWTVFIPGIACEVGALLLLFFTTWADVAEVTKAWKGL